MRLGTTLCSSARKFQNSLLFSNSSWERWLFACRAKMSGDSKPLYNVVFVLGGPGSGKGTQCEKIQQTSNFVHLSAGELLRQECLLPGSKFGAEIREYMKDGSIVPVKITCSLLRREMERSLKKNFLIDGFPRNRDNLEGWNETMTGVADVKRMLFFDCSDKVCVDRCINRGRTSGRSDDNAESMTKRLLIHRECFPIVDHYRAQNLVSTINAEQPPSKVFEDVKQILTALNL